MNFFDCKTKCKPTKEFWEHLLSAMSQIPDMMRKLERMETKMSQLTQEIEALRAEVAEDTTVIQSAVTLIEGFAATLASAVAAAIEAGATPESLQAITDLQAQLSTSKTALAAAVAANTPPVPPVP